MARPFITSFVPSSRSSASGLFNRVAGLSRAALPAFAQQQRGFTPSITTSFNTSTANMGFEKLNFKEAILNRRSIYQLTNESTISDEQIKEIVTTTIKNVPSAFNSQSTRLVVLLKEDHQKFWDIVGEVLKAHVSSDQWESTSQRIGGFRGGYGTVLFYEDPAPIKALQEKLPTYADKFPEWSEHTSAMHQFVIWTAFESEGLGCSLQHYQPLADQRASEAWKIPAEWSLKAQLVFGKPTADAKPKEKEFKPIDDRVFFHGLSS